MGLLERMTECVTGTAFISRSERAAVASNTGAGNEIDRLGVIVCTVFLFETYPSHGFGRP